MSLTPGVYNIISVVGKRGLVAFDPKHGAPVSSAPHMVVPFSDDKARFQITPANEGKTYTISNLATGLFINPNNERVIFESSEYSWSIEEHSYGIWKIKTSEKQHSVIKVSAMKIVSPTPVFLREEEGNPLEVWLLVRVG
ncbi:hypothetical protein SISSUDRAFT_1117075 [Sistotremastrum suecicum HHB10207 ss-3]|uniref:Ricin B lectin domain-containing protein n=1 Tax=Sistotremastrum suecicum HHB10207 ss-3 TaxID=1314776 RepID=A0A166H4J1_9AGAM|nr:hypothetical protein SISSUDRAFT_1117075 [Sistotremastrum suecicum HHB10207 ss-3]